MVKHFDGLDFTVSASPFTHYVIFEIYEIIGRMGKGPHEGERVYSQNGALTQLHNAPLCMRMTVKWDGCSDTQFHDPICQHACNRAGLAKYGRILLVCYDWAAELLENFDGD